MRKRVRLSPTEYIAGILAGNRVTLSRAITLIESNLEEDYALSQEVIAGCIPHSGKSFRIGITGVPGAGKSTFIDAFGTSLAEEGKKVAILAIDPSSTVSGGSILGDKTRMANLAIHPNAYIRPSPAGGSLGGVARKTRESMLLCEAAGFELIIVETVGVGQSEISVRSMTDFFLLLMLPNAGDELQGIKKGIMEMADAVLINKADGVLLGKARTAKSLYTNALRLFNPPESNWRVPVLMCSALEQSGIKEVWEMLESFQNFTKENHFWEKQRQNQALSWMHEHIRQRLESLFYQDENIKIQLSELSQKVANQLISPVSAANQLLESWKM